MARARAGSNAMPNQKKVVGTVLEKAKMVQPSFKAASPMMNPAKEKAVKVMSAKPHAVIRENHGMNHTVIKLVDSMGLEEMLEASKVVGMGIKGEKIPAMKSDKARVYAEKVLELNSKTYSKSKAERMIQKLNMQILEMNKKTTNAEASKQLYHELMAEE